MLNSFSRIRNNASAQPAHLPAPVGGWNARDSIAAMPPDDASLMDNAFPSTTDVMLRKGWDEHVTGISGQVQSLMVYNTPGGTQQMYAAAGTSFYNVSSSGAVGAAVQTGLSNAKWQSINFTDSGGSSWLVTVNGIDGPRYWDGATWTTVTAVSTPAIIGVTPTSLVHCTSHKNRLWFVETATLKAWYMPTDAVGGTASVLDLSAIAKYGGFIQAIDTWTIDAGEGVDDHWVAATSEGEVIVYKGSDPASSSTWQLVGVWKIGAPIGRRCMLKVGGDLLIVTVDGVEPMSTALISSRVNPRSAITDKIRQAMSDAVDLYGTNFGWQLCFYPKGDMLFLNVPVSEGSNQQQYAMNTISGNWGRFKGVEANCWAIFMDEPYFGSNGFVGQFWNTLSDNGVNIEADIKQAFNVFGRPGYKKHWTRARPIFATDGTPSVLIGLNVDYDDEAPTGTLTFNPTTYGVWDSALWDVGVWGGGLNVSRSWAMVNGIGFAAAIRLKITAQDIEVRWQATDLLMRQGAAL